MGQNIEQDNNTIEIDLGSLLRYLRKKIIFIVLISIIFGVIAGVYTNFLIPKKYASKANIFVEPKITDSTYSSTELKANDAMTYNYVVMLEGNNIQTKIANTLDLKVEKISSALSISTIEDTQIITIKATTTDSALSKQIVDTTVEIFIQDMEETFGVTNISIVDNAVRAKDPVSPSMKKNVVIGAAIGMILSLGVFFILFISDSKIHDKEQAEKYFGIPTFGTIPNYKR